MVFTVENQCIFVLLTEQYLITYVIMLMVTVRVKIIYENCCILAFTMCHFLLINFS